MEPVAPSDAEQASWAEEDQTPSRQVVIGGPVEGPDVIPCPALVARGGLLIHVAYQLDEIEVAKLAQGGRLWLTAWGGLPIHRIEVR